MFKKMLAIVFALLWLSTIGGYGQQTGRIYGLVVDAASGETLLGANVVITGTTRGTATNLDGRYEIGNLEPGEYSLTATYISFQPTTITGIKVEAGQGVKMDFTLTSESIGLEEITVSAAAVQNSDAALLSIQRKAIGFQDGISAEMISRSGGGDAASAMKKVVGASVVGGKYVYVRGLGDRYSSTHLNGVELPTADPDKKSFQLDLFPSALLDNIVTLKTFTADKPGNFSGGLVDVTTKDIPEAFFLNLSAKQGYNSQANLNDILLGKQSGSDWIGFDDGRRSEPGVARRLEQGEFPTDIQARRDPIVAAQLDEIANSFNSEFLPTQRDAFLNQSYSISLGDRFRFSDDFELGYTASYSYAQTFSAYTGGTSARFDLIGNFDDTNQLTRNIDLVDEKGQQNVDWGFLSTVGAIINGNNKITASFLRTQSGENQGRFLQGFWQQFNSEDIIFRSRVNQYLERDLTSIQLHGKHTLVNLNDVSIEWKASLQNNGQEQPDLRFIASAAQPFVNTDGVPDILLSNSRSQFPRPARFFRDLEEDKVNSSLDISIPLLKDELSGNFKFGGLYEFTDRTFRERRFEVQQGAGFSLNQFDSEEAFLNTLGVIGEDNRGRPRVGNFVVAATAERSNYDAEQTIFAFYGMFEFTVLERLKVVAGARYEDTDIETVSLDSTQAVGEIAVGDVLPSITLIYSLSDDINIRAAATRTLARPTFRELAPYISFDFVGDNLFRGNSELERTLITNFDLRFEWYPNPGELFAVSGFYKILDKPLERVIRFDIAEQAESIQNVDDGYVIGAEFEVRKNLGFLTDQLRHFQFSTNLTLVDSRVDVPELELVQIRATRPNTGTTRPLQGQSPFIFNADLSYLNPELGLNSTLSFNRFGDRLSRVTFGGAPNVFERSVSVLNFNTSKTFARNFKVSFSATNLLNPQIKFSQEFKGEEFIYQQFKRGRTYALGLSYSF